MQKHQNYYKLWFCTCSISSTEPKIYKTGNLISIKSNWFRNRFFGSARLGDKNNLFWRINFKIEALIYSLVHSYLLHVVTINKINPVIYIKDKYRNVSIKQFINTYDQHIPHIISTYTQLSHYRGNFNFYLQQLKDSTFFSWV